HAAKCPLGTCRPPGEACMPPSEKNASSQTALYHAIDMPTEHFGLFLLRMPDGVHAELAEDKRMFPGEFLQPEQITLEIMLVVKINIKTTKIGILRQQIFGWRISRIGKE